MDVIAQKKKCVADVSCGMKSLWHIVRREIYLFRFCPAAVNGRQCGYSWRIRSQFKTEISHRLKSYSQCFLQMHPFVRIISCSNIHRIDYYLCNYFHFIHLLCVLWPFDLYSHSSGQKNALTRMCRHTQTHTHRRNSIYHSMIEFIRVTSHRWNKKKLKNSSARERIQQDFLQHFSTRIVFVRTLAYKSILVSFVHTQTHKRASVLAYSALHTL